jgi:hypothetical protein
VSEVNLELLQPSAVDADPASPARGSACVTQDSTTGEFVLRFPSHVGKTIASSAIVELAQRLTERGRPAPIIVDLSEVQTFDLVAPLVALQAAAPVATLIGHVDIIASNALVRVAATSACRALGLDFSIRAPTP